MEDIKTEKTKKINSKTLIVAMDVAQEKPMVYFRCPDGREEKPFVVFNKREEYDRMWERISQTKDAYRLEEVVVGFESTVQSVGINKFEEQRDAFDVARELGKRIVNALKTVKNMVGKIHNSFT
ncbi:MAG: hypothetical protein A3J92_00170 [Planctomycetes bacterium RIFOXYC2_FULL_41_27]|nr:MAG: hypothetical protein A3J92_00170 [Planctomycetes bacterium RIFOXYC2_FULL_41_27]